MAENDSKSKSLRVSSHRYTFKSTFDAWYMVQQQLPNPDVVLRRRHASIMIYRELLSDAHLSAVLDSRESATLSFEWRLDRRDAPKRLYSAIENWHEEVLNRKQYTDDLSQDEFISNLMDVVYYGYQPVELAWDYAGGLWMPMEIVPKPPEWFVWFIGSSGIPELRFLSVNHMIDGESPPDDWTLLCPRIKPSFENPYGRGVASRCFWPVVFKRAGQEFWMNFLERFGQPWVKGTMSGQVSDTDMLSYASDLKKLVQDAVIVVSGTKDVELMEAKGAGQQKAGFDDMLAFQDSQISKTVLGHTLTTDVSDKGSYAATKGAMTVRNDIIERDVKMIRSIKNDLINMIYMRNGYRNEKRCEFTAYNPNKIDQDRAIRDEALSRAGVRFSKKYFVTTYHLQDDDIDKVIDPTKVQASGAARPPNTAQDKKEDNNG